MDSQAHGAPRPAAREGLEVRTLHRDQYWMVKDRDMKAYKEAEINVRTLLKVVGSINLWTLANEADFL
jgi:hypothetical protein